MMKKIVSVYIIGILVYGICGCAQTAEDTPYAGTEIVETENTETESEEEKDIEGEEKTHTEDTETTVNGEENGRSGEEIVSSESVDEQGKTDTESEEILREIEEYRSHFIGLYTSNVLSDEFPDLEPEMIIEEHHMPSDNGEGASLTVYSDLSGKKLRYELHYYGEIGNNVINYYLCDNFVWVSRQYNCYSSMTLRAGYSDVLYSTIENWIITDDAVYVMHDNGELEETDKTQLENEFPMPEEIETMDEESDTVSSDSDKNFFKVSNISNGQGSIEQIGDKEYRVTLYDINHNEVFLEDYSYMRMPPWFTMISDNIWEIGISVGSPARYTFYFDTETAEISDIYFNAKVFGDKYIAYMDSDVTGADEITLTLTDIFEKGILHQEVVRDFIACADPMSAIMSVEMIDETNIRLEYLEGTDYTYVSETIELEWTPVFND